MLKTLFFLICIFLFELLSINETIASDPFSKAQKIFSEGRYFEASIEFERAVFYESDINKIALYKYYKALCYKNLEEYDRALKELNEVNLFSSPDSLFFLIRYEQALCNYLKGDVNQSLWNIEDIRIRIDNDEDLIRIIPLYILCLNATRNWDKARDAWKYLLENSGLKDDAVLNYNDKIAALYNKKNIPRYLSPKKAQNLSRFIPGSGQMYCGAIIEGSVNFLINISLLGFAAYEIYTKYYITGYYIGLGMFNKTYHGGMHRAYIIANGKNDNRMNNFNLQNSTLLIEILNRK
jgi:tetratricopeptide (TPR) repeat protein